MSTRKIYIATSNEKKREEFARILGVRLEAIDLDIEEIQSLSSEEVCRRKAEVAFARTQTPILVDDTSLGLSALCGFPGALVTWILESGGPALLHRMLPIGAPATATATTVLGLADKSGVRLFSGTLGGTVIATARGEHGFGFDSVFVPEGAVKTMSEMEPAAKDSISPRRIALSKLLVCLRETDPAMFDD